jgi:hypothetical protein
VKMATIMDGSGSGVRRCHTHATNRTCRGVPFVNTCQGEGTSLLTMIKYRVFVLSRYERPIAHQNFSLGGGDVLVVWHNTAFICDVCLMLKLCHKIHIIGIAQCSITHSPNLNHQFHTS